MMEFDIVVIGGGHAGVEAAFSATKLGKKVALITLTKKMISNMPCNPHIGGSAKGIVVREIDALGGLMGQAADHHPLQVKMLNTGKGPGVQCLRTQQDKNYYPEYVISRLEEIENLQIIEDEAINIINDGNVIKGIKTKNNGDIYAKAVILTTGTYLNARIIRGREIKEEGPDGEKASKDLSSALNRLGIDLFRLKTGTPPRISKASIDFSKGKIEEGSNEHLCFSFWKKEYTPLSKQLPCYLIYTKDETLKIIRDNLSNSAIFDGTIKGIGPRYCPSIESKVVRFSDKERHQLFLEPEYENGDSYYLQGFSTGMPVEVQEMMVHSLPGLENAKILKWAYQIEYDAVAPFQFDSTLKIKKYEGLYVAGQICGTSGYEEAAGLGMMAGINASLWIDKKDPFILRREESYIGVMIDDLVTKGIDEPYRLLSSRAEFRLLLRHDNADIRLSKYGYDLGLLSEKEYFQFCEKYRKIDEIIKFLKDNSVDDKEGLKVLLNSLDYEYDGYGYHGDEILRRPNIHYRDVEKLYKNVPYELEDDEAIALEVKVKYQGYIARQEREIESIKKQQEIKLSQDLDYKNLSGIRLEAREKLDKVKPMTIAQASRIPGVTPADISVLLLSLRREGKL